MMAAIARQAVHHRASAGPSGSRPAGTRAASAMASCPFSASPTTSMSSTSSKNVRRPRRTTPWSSTSITRNRASAPPPRPAPGRSCRATIAEAPAGERRSSAPAQLHSSGRGRGGPPPESRAARQRQGRPRAPASSAASHEPLICASPPNSRALMDGAERDHAIDDDREAFTDVRAFRVLVEDARSDGRSTGGRSPAARRRRRFRMHLLEAVVREQWLDRRPFPCLRRSRWPSSTDSSRPERDREERDLATHSDDLGGGGPRPPAPPR